MSMNSKSFKMDIVITAKVLLFAYCNFRKLNLRYVFASLTFRVYCLCFKKCLGKFGLFACKYIFAVILRPGDCEK